MTLLVLVGFKGASRREITPLSVSNCLMGPIYNTVLVWSAPEVLKEFMHYLGEPLFINSAFEWHLLSILFNATLIRKGLVD